MKNSRKQKYKPQIGDKIKIVNDKRVNRALRSQVGTLNYINDQFVVVFPEPICGLAQIKYDERFMIKTY